MSSPMPHRVRVASSAILGSALAVCLAAVPASADTLSSRENSWTILAPAIPQLADPFVPIVDVDALRAQEERIAARAARQAAAERRAEREKERREKARAAARKARSQRVVPLAGGYHLTARFGDTGWYWSGGVHTGLDFAAPTGTDVRAAMSGTVIAAGWAGAYGQRIEIRHADGTVTAYNHLSSVLVGTGQAVWAGAHIGDVGSTGNVTGSHLHLEVTGPSGTMVDPAAWLGLR
jgi:murein DD-endopeptidase MepM/ murein hydrolase activator NlpD